MKLMELISQSPKVNQWLQQIDQQPRQLITGLGESAKMLVMASLLQEKKSKIVIATPNLHTASVLMEDFRHVLADDLVHLFPVNDITSVEMAVSSPEAVSSRVEALEFLLSQQAGIVIVPSAGLRKFVPSPKNWQQFSKNLAVGKDYKIEEIIQDLVLLGYERQGMVSRPGEFSKRGSILDVYPLTLEYPVRIDFFDEEVDSIRLFDPETQRSIESLTQVRITPATDVFVSSDQLKRAGDRLQKALDKQLTVISSEEKKEALTAYFEPILAQWTKGYPTEEDRYLVDYIYEQKTTLLNYLSVEDYVLIDDYSRILDTEKNIVQEEGEWQTLKLAESRLLPNQSFGKDIRSLVKESKVPFTFFSVFQKGMGNLKFQAVYDFQYRSMQQFFSQIPLLKVEMDRWKQKNQTVILYVSDEEKSRKAEELLKEHDIQVVVNHSDQVILHETQICIGGLQTGFELPEDKLVIITERELLQTQRKKKSAKRQHISNAERLKSYNELKPGDYVVHVNHGIGQYIGMETLEVDGVHQDYMTILYQNNDKLFIPVHQLDLIQKYVASESRTPRINKLGGTEWTKTKRKVSAKIEDIADDLIKLYAEREAEKGFAFSKDNDYQHEFEEVFPYSETDDQLRSIAEIKKDMEQDKPMDRLLVGDVGYGKTEVALRAAFKAVQDGKQVAFLVPTTILAQQHYETMMERFEDFPVEIGVLSRFRTRKQQTETLDKLRKGQIDILVGTHRILSKDVEFQDLGLLIIDEEQRFGVKHKERLKQLRSQVDVLTLTATPIPRTLHMSMLGVRDLSVIETPPAERYPVQTYVMETNPGAIRDAVEREMARGGQVFYLYNRVDTIEQKVDELHMLIPDARIAYAHGQMTEVQLENVLFDFIAGDYDVLVTTTIIETGVDIPNVNTLFVENADYMGLSQLYQLRGRVGRSNRIAFAYFMYEPQKVLTEVSEKRLQAMKDFTELGSGFKIAMRDLSIRGAGNLLGAQQHGFIDSVGFDMYTQMLSEAVARKQGRPASEFKTSTEIDLEIDAYIPAEYIQDERQKIEIYKRIRELDSIETYNELEDDLLDRFGEYPNEVAYLLSVGLIKMSADYALVEKIRRNKQVITITLSSVGTNTYTVQDLLKSLTATSLKADVGEDDGNMQVNLHIPPKTGQASWLNEVEQLMNELSHIRQLIIKKQEEKEKK